MDKKRHIIPGVHITGRVLDGLAEIEQQVHFPQIERDILMQVDAVEDFRCGAVERPPRRR